VNASLEMFFDDEVFIFTERHKAILTTMWKKYGKGHSMAQFNAEYHTGLLRQQNNANLLYRVSVGIPVYSELARKVAIERGLIT
jgi:hypothetical protein